MISNAIAFYKDCYLLDKNRSILNNFFHRSISHQYFLEEKDDIIEGFSHDIFLPKDKIFELEQKAAIYKEEKEIIYGTAFVVGKFFSPEQAKVESVLAPLCIGRCHILQKDKHKTVSLQGPLDINEGLLRQLIGSCINQDRWQHLLDRSKQEDISSKNIMSWIHQLERDLPELQSFDMIHYPKLKTEEELLKAKKDLLTSSQTQLLILPCSAIALANKTNSPRGILSELEQLIITNDFSSPLTHLLGASSDRPEQNPCRPIFSSSLLSDSQNKAITASEQHHLSTIVGPPGTGKTHTIVSIAMDKIIKGQSVLIASKNDSALDVVSHQLSDSMGIQDVCLRGGTHQHLKKLKNHLENILSGIYFRNNISKNTSKNVLKYETEGQFKTLLKLNHKIQNLEHHIEKHRLRLQILAPFLDLASPKLHERIKFIWNKLFIVFRPNLSKSLQKLYQLWDARDRQTKDYSKYLHQFRIGHLLNKDRKSIANYLSAIRSRTGTRMSERFSKINEDFLLEMFPIWLSNLTDLHRSLPLKKEFFDLVIIDEASLCDISSCLPALQRAKKAIVVGDPKQLRHLSFLSQFKEFELMEKHQVENEGIEYRHQSILDLSLSRLTHSDQQSFLNEHYRGAPDLIAFSNEKYYNGKLIPMTDHPEASTRQNISFIHCLGRRTKKGSNTKEVTSVIAWIQDWIQNQMNRKKHDSIGILSPFKDQVEAISKAIYQTFSMEQIERLNLLVGTPYSFQGDERDIMLISLCIDSKSHPNALHYLERDDIFNVSTTRAKKRQVFFHSFDPQNLKTTSTLRLYFERMALEPTNKLEIHHLKDLSHREKMLIDKLSDEGYDKVHHRKIAGQHSQIWVSRRQDSGFMIDLIGFSNKAEKNWSIERYKISKRMGLPIFPLSCLEWKQNPQKVIQNIRAFLT